MHETSDSESYGKDHLGFDCPGCGAMLGVAPSKVGHAFTCPECGKETVLTKENTRKGHLTEVQAAAARAEEEKAAALAHERSKWEAYGGNHVTFDCPWCGAISGVDPSHLGEHFDCPECHRATKLTEQTTRKSEVTEAPPDAPPHVEPTSKLPLVLGALVLVVGAVVAFLVLGSSPSDDEQGTTVAGGPGTPAPTDETPEPAPGEAPTPAEPVPAEPVPAEPVPGDPVAGDPVAGDPVAGDPVPAEPVPAEPVPAEPVPGEPVPGEPGEAPPADDGAVSPAVAEAEARLRDASAALAAWVSQNPDVVEGVQLRDPCLDILGEAMKLRDEVDAGAASPDAARAFNERVRAYVSEDEQRPPVIARLAAWLDADRLKPQRARDWRAVNFFAPRTEQGLVALYTEWESLDASEHDGLTKTVAEAKAALDAARSGAAGASVDEPVKDE